MLRQLFISFLLLLVLSSQAFGYRFTNVAQNYIVKVDDSFSIQNNSKNSTFSFSSPKREINHYIKFEGAEETPFELWSMSDKSELIWLKKEEYSLNTEIFFTEFNGTSELRISGEHYGKYLTIHSFIVKGNKIYEITTYIADAYDICFLEKTHNLFLKSINFVTIDFLHQ